MPVTWGLAKAGLKLKLQQQLIIEHRFRRMNY